MIILQVEEEEEDEELCHLVKKEVSNLLFCEKTENNRTKIIQNPTKLFIICFTLKVR